MATYYVRKDGNDTNAGTGSAANQAWQTVQKALGSTGIVSGDTVYIAPGIYSEQITVGMTNPTATTSIIGNPTSSLFPGVNAGQVIITNLNSTLSANSYTGTVVTSSSKNFLSWQNISFKTYGNILMNAPSSRNLSFIKCSFVASNGTNLLITNSAPTSAALNLTIQDCIFVNGSSQLILSGNNISDTTNIQTSVFIGASTFNIDATSLGGIVTNNAFLSGGTRAINLSTGSVTFPLYVQNSLFMGSRAIDLNCGGVANAIVENYNRLLGTTPRSNVANNGTSSVAGDIGIDIGESLLFGLNNLQPNTSIVDSPNKSFGTASNAPAADMYDVTWTGTSPDAGSGTYRVITSNPTNIQYNGGNERNASTITIAPGSTSQSIELYLGATGLTASTSGLSAYYNRTRSADVQIPLVARTIAQAWTSGGFAEVNANTMPGVYRLDLPDAAVAAGADDVTVVVRGASGTNGAVMTIKLSSGGLTAAQTASAILDAVGASYVTAGSIGYAIQNSNVASISGSTAAADELEGALLHNGTDYISAQLIAGGGGGAGDVGGNIINLNEDPEVVVQSSAWVGDWHTYVLRLVDSNGTPYDITNDTLAVTFTNVATGSAYAFGGGSATITKQMNGQGILSILNPAAYPSAAVIRLTVSATIGSDVRRFGPLEIEVLAP